MSGPPPGGFTPRPPPPAIGRLSNYFGSTESPDNPFAFATKVPPVLGKDPFLQQPPVTPMTAFDQHSNNDPLGFINAPPTGLPGNDAVNQNLPPQTVAPQPIHQHPSFIQQGGVPPIGLHALPRPPDSAPPVSFVSYPVDASIVPQTGQPPTYQMNEPSATVSETKQFSQHHENSSFPYEVAPPTHREHASTLPFTGQQVTNQLLGSQSSNALEDSPLQTDQPLHVSQQHKDNLNAIESSLLSSRVPHSLETAPPPPPPTDPVPNNELLTHPHRASSGSSSKQFESSSVDSQQIPLFTSNDSAASVSGLLVMQSSFQGMNEQSISTEIVDNPITVSNPENSPVVLSEQVTSIQSHDGHDQQVIINNSQEKDGVTVAVCQPVAIFHQVPEAEKIFPSSTSLTGSTGSTGTNTPLPPVAALPLYHSHSVPNNLHGAAEKLTNAHYVPRHSYTNADWRLNENDAPTENKSLPSSSSNTAEINQGSRNFVSLPSNFQQNNGFSIGPIDDMDEDDVSEMNSNQANLPDKEQELVTEMIERTVVEGDSNPPSHSQSSSSFVYVSEKSIIPPSTDTQVVTAKMNASPPTANEPLITGTPISITYPHIVATINNPAIANDPSSTEPEIVSSSSSDVVPQRDCIPSSARMPTPSLNNVIPFIPPSIVGINTDNWSDEIKKPVSDPVSHPDPLPVSSKMEQEDVQKLDGPHPPPNGQGQQSFMSVPPSLSIPPTIDLTLQTTVPSEPPLIQPQSLQSSSTSAFSMPLPHPPPSILSQSVDLPPPPVVQPHSQLKRNSSLTNAGIIDQTLLTSTSSSVPPPYSAMGQVTGHVTDHVSTEQGSLNIQPPPTTMSTNQTPSDHSDHQKEPHRAVRTPLAGQERPEDDSYQGDHDDHYRRDTREPYDRRYERGRDAYYYNSHRYYRHDDRPHSRSAYSYELRDYDYPEKGYYGGRDYRDDRRGGHYNSFYDDREHYWRGQGQDYYHDYDRYQYDRYRQDHHEYNQGYREYRDHYYQDYYYPDERRRHYEGYPPDRSHSRQHYNDNTVLPDESSIYGHHESYMDSPGSQYQHGGYDHRESTRIEQPDYSSDDYRHGPYPERGEYPPDVGERYPIEGYRQEEEEPFRPIQGAGPL